MSKNIEQNEIKSVNNLNVSATKEFEQRFLIGNVFNGVAKGFVIMDTKNNPTYPLNDVLLDKSRFDSEKTLLEYRRVYGVSPKEIYMPWHFQIELVARNYVIQTTRPYNYKSRLPKYKDYICICLVGDSKNDVYLPEIYNKIANMCIKPYTQAKINKVPLNIIYNVDNTNFSKNQLEKYL